MGDQCQRPMLRDGPPGLLGCYGVDDEGREVADGEPGEMACRGPHTLRGYYKLPDHNARTFTEDGFF